MALAAGTRLGVYEITGFLGAGGMGEVYRAKDTRLGRDVAIKILQDLTNADAERLARFEREARLLASLNHPHIGAIYGFEDAGALPALVLELVEGETLADRLRREPLPLKEALTIAAQIAEGLESAHERGIVHRDLKPANIKVSADGVVKVLDFGLAKAAGSDKSGHDQTDSPTITAEGTREGVILGTAAYMSPEQARGKPVDRRADIWAFGCVLYELLARRRAFEGQTATDTLVAILERDPHWQHLPHATPMSIRRLLRRCLEKDAKRRLRDIGDARLEIDEALSSPGDGQPASTRDHSALRFWRVTAVGAVLLAAAAGLTAYVARRPSQDAGSATTRMTASRLTSYSGRQYSATLAPDGRSFAFVSDHTGPPDIWLRQVFGGEPIRLTNDAWEEEDLAFAPDGESIYFTRIDDTGQAIWQIGALGGQARKVIANGHSAAPSRDGRALAYMTVEKADLSEALIVGPLDGSEPRTLARQVPAFPRVRPAWSPDGRFITYVRAGLFAPSNLFVVEASTGRERQVTTFTRPAQGIGQHVWLPDNRRLVVSYASGDSSRIPVTNDLAVLDIADGSLARVTTTIVDSFVGPSLSADGSRLVATATGLLREVWKVPLESADPDANSAAAVRLIDSSHDPLWTFVSRDGRTLVYNSPASGTRNLWSLQLGPRATPQQMTALPGNAVTHSALSPDGMRVALVSFAGGASDIWTQNIDGTDLRQLTNDPAGDSWPTWSPDGRSIAYTSVRQGAQQTWIVPAQGGPAEKLIDGFFRGDWVEQPGGGTMIVTSNNRDAIRLIDVEKRAILWEERMPGSAASVPMFSPDRRSVSLVVVDTTGSGAPVRRSPGLLGVGSNAVAVVDVASHKPRIVARMPFPINFRAGWVDNATALVVNRNDPVSNIVMFDRFWEPQR